MTEKRFSLSKDTEWWFVQDNTIQVNKYGYRDDLTGEDEYRGLHQELTEQETVDLLNEVYEENKELKHRINDFKHEIHCLKHELKQMAMDTDMVLNNQLKEENKELKLQLEAFKDKLCELGVSDVKLYGKRHYTGLEEWLE